MDIMRSRSVTIRMTPRTAAKVERFLMAEVQQAPDKVAAAVYRGAQEIRRGLYEAGWSDEETENGTVWTHRETP
jgi:hypothetical protein